MKERYMPERIWIDSVGIGHWYDHKPNNEQTEEYVRANGYLACQQESEGVVVELTVEDHTVLLPPEIESGKYVAQLTRIQDCDDPAYGSTDEFCDCETSAHEKCGGAN